MNRTLTTGVAALALFCAGSAAAQQSVAVLSPDDVRRYRQIFADERSGDFADAQTLVSQLSDRSLVGYAQAEHYLSEHSSASLSDLVAGFDNIPTCPSPIASIR